MTHNSKFKFVRSYLFLEIFVQFILFTHCLEIDLYPDPLYSKPDKFNPVNSDESSLTIPEKSNTLSDTGGNKLNETAHQGSKPNQTVSVIRKSMLGTFSQKNISGEQILSDSTFNKLLKAYNNEEIPVTGLELSKTRSEEDATPDPPKSRAYHDKGSDLSTTPAPPVERYVDPLNNLHQVPDMFGIELKTAVYIVAALGIVHVFFYGCTLFMNLSYMLVTIWVLVLLYSTISLILFIALPGGSTFVLRIWTWYSLCFVAMMCLMMLLVAAWFCVRAEYSRLSLVFIGLAWYALTMYFVLVVNSYRMQLEDKPALDQPSE